MWKKGFFCWTQIYIENDFVTFLGRFRRCCDPHTFSCSFSFLAERFSSSPSWAFPKTTAKRIHFQRSNLHLHHRLFLLLWVHENSKAFYKMFIGRMSRRIIGWKVIMGVYNDRDLTNVTFDVDNACGYFERIHFARNLHGKQEYCVKCRKNTTWSLRLRFVRGR